MKIFKRDVFGNVIFIKRLLIMSIGAITFSTFNRINKTKLEGTEHLKNLPRNKVLFVSNHQTYFTDVIAFLHVFSSIKWNFKNSISNPVYLLNPNITTSFIAAKETMRAGILPKIFGYVGSLQVKRTWREAGKNINRQVDMNEFSMIEKALENGWVITFPQGTTSPFAPGRRGTAHIIKQYNPIVIPVVIDGFRRAFDKKGIRLKKKDVQLSIRFKSPMVFDPEADSGEILQKIMQAIEQSEAFYPKHFVPSASNEISAQES